MVTITKISTKLQPNTQTNLNENNLYPNIMNSFANFSTHQIDTLRSIFPICDMLFQKVYNSILSHIFEYI